MRKKIFWSFFIFGIVSIVFLKDINTSLANETNQTENYTIVKDDETLMKYSLLKGDQWSPMSARKKISTIPVLTEPQVMYKGDGEKNSAKFLYDREKNTVAIEQSIDARVNMGVRQQIATVKGRSYQFSVKTKSAVIKTTGKTYKAVDGFDILDGGISEGDQTSLIPVEYTRVNNSFTESDAAKGKDRTDRVTFKAKSDKTTIELSALSNDQINANGAYWSDISFIDFENGIVESKKLVEDLFTDTTHNSIKLSTTQAIIDKAKARVEELFDEKTKTALLAEITKAQNLMDKIQLKLTVEELTDDRTTLSSQTIKGTTYPEAFLYFSGHEGITEGTLSSGVVDDKRKYLIRADSKGSFEFKLTKGNYFRGGQVITIISALNGKEETVSKTVTDKVAPFKPTLNPLKDTDTEISGSAETDATVKLYDASDDKEITSVKGKTGDQFTLTVPDGYKPYKRYYVTATDAGKNVSEKSDIQEVKDTLPPKATPVKQRIKLGDPLPEITELLTDIDDNAGVDQLTMTITKEADLSKVGATQVEITLTDKAKNKLVVTVPIFVYTEGIIENDQDIFFAEDFSVLAIDFPKDLEDQKKYILDKSKATVWDKEDWSVKETTFQIEVGSLKSEPGVYSVTISGNQLKKTIHVELLKGELTLEKIPTQVSFGEPIIKSNTQYVTSKLGIDLTMKDSRFQRSSWRLVTKLKRPFQNNKDESTTTGLVYKDEDQLLPITTKDTVVLYEEKKIDSNRDVKVTLNQQEGPQILLKVLPGSVRADTDYNSEIMWIIEDAP
ncbi:hypothetical protein I580_01979 [Enterococcus caccae ATCC BAA-1240]|uniref:Uncharacterized protein n=1 Tax=Enterococcus caccae ATCC BAA-1240 TaxID=1158612 RepID=R3WDB7_9ENTE|nr:hypothetical protein UC7_01678 [Enterococcus caccae ATCC BAA-1240]EOT61077.1 hypothetical protein I580_01979 [Enterococcus caccae ATCC BAA-1240]